MVEHVRRRAERARMLETVAVATDDRRIAECVLSHGGLAVMTSARHATGTDRIAEALGSIESGSGRKYDIVVNIQGDEPMVEPRAIDALVRKLRRDREASVATVVCPIRARGLERDPNTVKVALDLKGRALYFSRCPIPYFRKGSAAGHTYYRHIGIYAYRRGYLERFIRWGRGPLERAESLEQLRVLENGGRIAVVKVARGWPAVDTPEDLERVRKLAEAPRADPTKR